MVWIWSKVCVQITIKLLCFFFLLMWTDRMFSDVIQFARELQRMTKCSACGLCVNTLDTKQQIWVLSQSFVPTKGRKCEFKKKNILNRSSSIILKPQFEARKSVITGHRKLFNREHELYTGLLYYMPLMQVDSDKLLVLVCRDILRVFFLCHEKVNECKGWM